MDDSLRRCLCALALVTALGLGLLADEPCTVTLQPGESVQAAINEVPEGAVICLAEGTWEEHLDISKSLTLRGQTEAATIQGYEWGVPVIRVTAPSGVEVAVVLEGLTVTGGTGPHGHGIRIEASAQAVIERSTVEGNERYGVGISGFAQATIENSIIQGNETGILLRQSAQTTITGSTIWGNARWGIGLLGSAQAIIERSTVEGNGAYGIGIADFAQATIDNATIQGNETGILMWQSAQTTITDSIIEGNRGDGIQMTDFARATIDNATVGGNEANGIYMRYSAHVIITRSTIGENAGYGMVLERSTMLSVEQTRIIRNGRSGVILYEQPCIDHVEDVFTGSIIGRRNTVPGPDEEDGNQEDAFCPAELSFLLTEEGGELDR